MNKGGRPPISEGMLEQLKTCFRRHYGPSAAALECGVHRNTASTYFAALRRNDDFQWLRDTHENRRQKEVAKHRAGDLEETVWRAIRDRALKSGATAKELIARIVRTVVEDGLLDEILGGDPGDGKSLVEAINEVVPRSLEAHQRADICQDLLLAVLEGETTIEKLKDGSAECVKRYYKLHPGKFGPLSFDAPIPGTDGLTLADTLTDETTHF